MPLSRKTQLRRSRMKPTRPKVSSEEQATRKIVNERSGGFCEGRLSGCLGRATDKAHRVGEGVGGAWSAVNILDLCRVCHRWCHDNPKAAKDLGLMLESWQDPAKEPTAYMDAGFVLLDNEGGLWPVGDEAA